MAQHERFEIEEVPGLPGPHRERHFTPGELGKLWGMHAGTIRRIFRDEPGVIRLGSIGRRSRRDYLSLRIPESVARRKHTQLSARRHNVRL